MSHHTPGPWRPWEGGPSHMVIGSDERTVACLSRLSCPDGVKGSIEFADMETRTANARLIAAAPKLYSAVYVAHRLLFAQLATQIESGEVSPETQAAVMMLAEAMDEAVPKAEGGAA